jgi:hypothetical protein
MHTIGKRIFQKVKELKFEYIVSSRQPNKQTTFKRTETNVGIIFVTSTISYVKFTLSVYYQIVKLFKIEKRTILSTYKDYKQYSVYTVYTCKACTIQGYSVNRYKHRDVLYSIRYNSIKVVYIV